MKQISDDSILVPASPATAVPGTGLKRLAATRDAEGTYCMIYVPAGRRFRVRMDAIKGPQVRAWWFNPRTGRASAAGNYANTGELEFMSPEPGEMIDWVLVLDDASRAYPEPGIRR